MEPGPDVLTSCGSPRTLLKIDQQYVVGVGGVCEAISDWSTLDSYTSSELQQLRDLAQDLEEGTLKCGTLGLLPSLTLVSFIAIAIAGL